MRVELDEEWVKVTYQEEEPDGRVHFQGLIPQGKTAKSKITKVITTPVLRRVWHSRRGLI